MEPKTPMSGRTRAASRGTLGKMSLAGTLDELSGGRPRTRGLTIASSARQTIAWPFGGPPGPDSPTTIPLSYTLPRRSTWGFGRPVSSIFSLESVVPDYVVNFMRGETPESLARKRIQHRGPLNPEFQHTRNHHSRAVNLYDARANTPDFFNHSRSPSAANDLDRMLVVDEKGVAVRRQRSWITGWRGGFTLNILLTLLILIAAIACLIVSALKAQVLGGVSTIVEGRGGAVGDIGRGLHVVVNVFGVVLLTGANYVFQVLVSPTREETNAAHEKKKWLDIGVPSLRNMWSVAAGRVFLSIFILTVALGSQVIYNALLHISYATTPDKIDASTAATSCSLSLDGTLLGVIVLLNLVLLFGFIFALTRKAFEPLATLGDAATSFLNDPDPTTQGACLITRHEASNGSWGLREAKYWTRTTHFWAQTPSLTRWMGWAATWVTPVALTAAALAISLKEQSSGGLNKFGDASVLYSYPVNTPRTGLAILASLPHLLLGALYLSTNALFTTFYLSHEFSQYALLGLPLPFRLSSGQPKGVQICSLYLTLPRPVSWLLFFLFVAMGFILSQALFLATFDVGDGTTTASLGLSSLALVILMALLFFLGLITMALSLRSADATASIWNRLPAGNPLVLAGGSCSAVLSARCHRIPQESEVATQEVNWGVVYEGGGMSAGHATFSSRAVGMMKVGRVYS